jgi:CheY-like chemotaxis protein
VVDDDESALLLIKQVLVNAGYLVRIATNDDDAVTLFQVEPADLLLIDKNLPGTSGFNVITRLRSLYPDLPAIVVTAHPEPVLSGVTKIQGYLAKPFERLSVLTDTVANVLSLRSRLIKVGLAKGPPERKRRGVTKPQEA